MIFTITCTVITIDGGKQYLRGCPLSRYALRRERDTKVCVRSILKYDFVQTMRTVGGSVKNSENCAYVQKGQPLRWLRPWLVCCIRKPDSWIHLWCGTLQVVHGIDISLWRLYFLFTGHQTSSRAAGYLTMTIQYACNECHSVYWFPAALGH